MSKTRKTCKMITIMLSGVLVVSMMGCSSKSENYGKGKDEPIERTYQITDKHSYQIGDKVEKILPLPENEKNVSIRYVVNDAKIYANPTEAGIAQEQIIPKIEYQKRMLEGGDSVTREEAMKSPFVLVDITITNVNDKEPNVSVFSLVSKKEKENEEDKEDLMIIGTPCYYSQAKEEMESQKYWDFSLLPGESTTMKIGWYVNLEDCTPESIFLTDNLYGDEKWTGYVDLGLESTR